MAPSTSDFYYDNVDIHTATYGSSSSSSSNDDDDDTNNVNNGLPIWFQASSFRDENDNITNELVDEKMANGEDLQGIVTKDMVNQTVDDLATFELNENGEYTLLKSDCYAGGLTWGGGIVNNGCTQRGVYTVAAGDTRTITYVDDNGNTVTRYAAAAMADSFDCAQDLYIESMIPQLVKEYGAWTYAKEHNGVTHDGMMQNAKEIEEKYGIRITEIECEDVAGKYRTYSFSLVDNEGNVIENTDGSKASIIWGDWVIPDGNAQGAENNLSSILDQLGYECVSKADFINNEALGGAEGYHEMLGMVAQDVEAIRNGQEGKFSRAGSVKDTDLYLSSTFIWGNIESGGFGSSKYGNATVPAGSSGIYADLDGDNLVSDGEADIETDPTAEGADGAKGEDDEDGENQGTTQTNGEAQQTGDGQQAVAITNANVNELEDLIAAAQEENPEVDVDDIIAEYAEDNNLDEKELARML